MKFLKWLNEYFEEAMLIVLLVLITCVELVQVIFRNLPFVPALTWAEEFCRFCWIWSVFISLPYTIRKDNMLRVSVLLDIFPQKVRSAINILVDVITTSAMVLLGVNSIEVVQRILKSGETSPAMRWPMWIVYSVMLIGFLLGTIRGLQQICIHVKHFNDKKLNTIEQTMADAAEESETARKVEGGQA